MATAAPGPAPTTAPQPDALSAEDARKAQALRKMKTVATLLLVFAAVVFLIAKINEDQGTWVGYVRAIAEAAMVGALILTAVNPQAGQAALLAVQGGAAQISTSPAPTKKRQTAWEFNYFNTPATIPTRCRVFSAEWPRLLNTAGAMTSQNFSSPTR